MHCYLRQRPWELAINFGIITGWFPVTVVIVAIASVVLSVGWHRRSLEVAAAHRHPDQLRPHRAHRRGHPRLQPGPRPVPHTFYLWAWLIWYSVVVVVLGWTRAHWLLRTFSVIAIVFCVIAAFTVVNQTYDYYPTLARLFGKDAANFADLPELSTIRNQVRETGKLPDQGSTIAVTIPADHLEVPDRAGLRLPAAGLVQEPRALAAGRSS